MAQTVGRGGTIRLDSIWKDGGGLLDTPTNPRVDILNPSGVAVVTDAVPTEQSTGMWFYDYTVADDAPLGVWTAHWTGSIDGVALEDDDDFTVTLAGSVAVLAATDFPPCVAYATTDDLCSPCDDYTFPTGLLDDMLEVASQIVYKVTGEQWTGLCTETVYPRCQRRYGSVAPSVRSSLRSDSRWPFPPRDGCCGHNRISLGGYPLRQIHEVVIDGVTLDAEDYRIEDDRWLTRTDCTSWPCSCCSPDDETLFSVEYSFGYDPPLAVTKATADLACQLALACDPETLGECVLPSNVSSITRQGVTAELIPLDAFAEGRSGLASLDRVVWAYNPDGTRGRSLVARADFGRAVTRRT